MANMILKNFELSHNFELTVFELTGSDLYLTVPERVEGCNGEGCSLYGSPVTSLFVRAWKVVTGRDIYSMGPRYITIRESVEGCNGEGCSLYGSPLHHYS